MPEMSRGGLLLSDENRDFQVGAGTLAWGAAQGHSTGRAVNDAQPLVHIAQANAARHGVLQSLVGDADAIVLDVENQQVLLAPAADRDVTRADLARQTVLDRIL